MKRLLIILEWREVLSTFVIALFSGVMFYKLYGLHGQSFIYNGGDGVWFSSDIGRVYRNMLDRQSLGHYRVKVHPLFSLLTYPPTFVLRILGIGPFKAVQLVTASTASLWFIAMYVLLRLAGCLRFDAMLFSALGMCSAAAIFWFSVPETYALGSISIAVGLSLAALSNYKHLPAWSYVAVSCLTLSVTVTNWMVGILSTFLGNPWRRAISITLISLSIVTLLWSLEKYIFPNAVFFTGDGEEAQYMFSPNIKRCVSVLKTFVFHTMLSPVINIIHINGEALPVLSIQASLPGSEGLLSLTGTIIWIVLLGLGFWALFTLKKLFALRIVLGLSLIGQITLHVLYGEETFLYSLNFLPLLITLAALATLTHLRASVILLTIILIPIAAVSNWDQFKEANAIATSLHHEAKNISDYHH